MDPYIGITGFTRKEEVEKVLDVFPKDFKKRKLMVGVLVGYKSLRGIPLNPRWQKRFPDPKTLPSLFLKDQRVLNIVHYCPKDFSENFLADMKKIEEMAGENFNGFQINASWPPAEDLKAYKKISNKLIILQINNKAIEEAETVDGILRKLNEYSDFVDSILLDTSGGSGKLFEPTPSRTILNFISKTYPHLGIGIAGGLGPNTVELISPLLEEFPDLSIDAEGALRNQDNELDILRAQIYLDRALEILS